MLSGGKMHLWDIKYTVRGRSPYNFCFRRSFIQKIKDPRSAEKATRGSVLWVVLKLLLKVKGLAVCALVHCRIALVGANLNGVKRTIILVHAMMLAVVYCALNTFVSLIHINLPPLIGLQFYYLSYRLFYSEK